tara:strand:+ start:1982 stop:3520 length:1539 start_codon:yes stop_codon:yes gene_type:complete
MAILNLLRILYIFSKYRLDELFDSLNNKNLILIIFLIPRIIFKKKGAVELRVADALEEMGPLFIKFGQLLSTRPDLVGTKQADSLKKFLNKLEPFPAKEAIKIVEEELGGDISNHFAKFERTPIAAASIAQVHKAELHSGELVAVKIVRPGLNKRINSDIRTIRFLGNLAEKFLSDARRLKLMDLIEEYELVITSETNLKKEAANAIQTGLFFKDNNDLYVPKVYEDFSGLNVMTMEMIDGIPVTEMSTLNKEKINLKALSETGVRIFFKQLFEDNFFHADMHPGNIFVDPKNPENPTYIAVDYAICGSLTEREQLLIGKMLAEMFNKNYLGVAKTMIKAKWVSGDTKEIELEIVIRTVLDPIFEKPFNEIKFGEMLLFLFEATRGFHLSLPSSLLLLNKTLINIEGLGREIYPNLDLWTTAKPFIQNWVAKKYSPKAIFEKFKNDSFALAEKAYELPEKIEIILENISNLEDYNKEIRTLKEEMKENKKNNNKFWYLGLTALVIISLVLIQ